MAFNFHNCFKTKAEYFRNKIEQQERRIKSLRNDIEISERRIELLNAELLKELSEEQ